MRLHQPHRLCAIAAMAAAMIAPSARASVEIGAPAATHAAAPEKSRTAARTRATVKPTPPATTAFGGKPARWTVVAESESHGVMPDAGPPLAAETIAVDDPSAVAAGEPLETTPATVVVEVGSTDGPSLGGGYAFLLGAPGPAGAGSDALTCLTQAVYFEARSEPLEGQEAVAQVVMNRTRMAQYPSQVCGVVFQGADRATGCQFSFACDGALGAPAEAEAWRRANMVAQRALSGFVYSPLKDATHFHATYVNPYWSGSLTRLGQIGAHIFYH